MKEENIETATTNIQISRENGIEITLRTHRKSEEKKEWKKKRGDIMNTEI